MPGSPMQDEWERANPPTEHEQQLTEKSANCLIILVKIVAALIAVFVIAFVAVLIAAQITGIQFLNF